jgi:hypothetical protein
MKKIKSNANMSESYKANYCQEEPEKSTLGAKVPAAKDNRGSADTSSAKHEIVTVVDAKEVPNAAKDAISAQTGRGTKTGGDLGDATTHPNSGCGESE